MGKKEWFGEWFDSPYYHILYKHRDGHEAQYFIDNVVDYLGITTSNKLMDLACGKGRHSIYLNEKGFNVVGLDLSSQNIAYANRFSNSRLKFFEHDMRKVFQEEAFDYVFNLFTSFGYFDDSLENQLAINAIAQSLKKEGKLVLDFLNPYVVINNLVSCETKTVAGIDFEITREYSDGFILKNIRFNPGNGHVTFQEKVKAIRRVEFLHYFKISGLEVTDVFGDYELNQYEAEKSDRLIFIVQKYSLPKRRPPREALGAYGKS